MEEASRVAFPDPPRRTRYKQKSRKMTHEERKRDAINKKLKEAKRQKLEETKKPIEPRISTRVEKMRAEKAKKEKKEKAEKAEKENEVKP